MKKTAVLFAVLTVLTLLLNAARAETGSALIITDSAVNVRASMADVNGDFILSETDIDNETTEGRITISAVGPVALVLSEQGYGGYGIIIPKRGKYSRFEMVWAFAQAPLSPRYRGRVNYDTSCASREILLAISGEITYRGLSRQGSFTAIKVTTLSVTISPEGAGQVTSDDVKIVCESSCQVEYVPHCSLRAVNLTAQADTGYEFDFWRKDGLRVADNPIAVSVDDSVDLTAVFKATGGSGVKGPCCFYECTDGSSNQGDAHQTSDAFACAEFGATQCTAAGAGLSGQGIVNCTDCSAGSCFEKWEGVFGN